MAKGVQPANIFLCMVKSVLLDQQYSVDVKSSGRGEVDNKWLAGRFLQPLIPVLHSGDGDQMQLTRFNFENCSANWSTVDRVVHQHLMLRKVSTCWVPKQLKPEQQAIHNDVARQLSVSYDTDGEVMLERVVTGDGTWIHHHQPETKQASMQWKHKDSPKVVLGVSGENYAGDLLGHEVCFVCWISQTWQNCKYSSLLERLKTAVRRKCRGLITRGVIVFTTMRDHILHVWPWKLWTNWA